MDKHLKSILLVYMLSCLTGFKGKAQDITTGLIAHYQFESIAGNVITNEIGGNDGANYGAALEPGGKIGNALRFDGTDDYVYIPGSPALRPPVFTLALWVKSDGAQGGHDRIFGFTGYSYGMDVSVGGSANSLLVYPGTWYDTGYDLAYNTWTHIAITYDGTFRVYADGTEVASYVRARTLSGNMYIGSNYHGGEGFDGVIDDVRLYNRVLTVADITELYDPGAGTVPALSVSDTTVNESSGSTTFTISINRTGALPVSGNYDTNNGTATAGNDYIAQTGAFTIPAGQLSTTVSAPVINDTETEGNETFSLKLSNPSNALVNDNTGVCTITDDDVPGLSSCSSTISTFTWSESFETGGGVWENIIAGDGTDWTRHPGNTPTLGTGPTAARDGSYYYYIEATDHPAETAILAGPCFDLTGKTAALFSFHYHMYGSTMGSMALEASADGANWASLWNLSGNQGDAWYMATVNLAPYLDNTVQLRFSGTTGSSFASDMAIDNLSLAATGDGPGGTGGTGLWAQDGSNIYFNDGNVGIGTSSPDEKLTVNGKIHAEEVRVSIIGSAPDYVFDDKYPLLTVAELESYLKKNSHLPDIPPARELERKGVSLSESNMLLLRKIEELTLYIINQEKRIKRMETGKDNLPQKQE